MFRSYSHLLLLTIFSSVAGGAPLSYKQALDAAVHHSLDTQRAGNATAQATINAALVKRESDPKLGLGANWTLRTPDPKVGASSGPARDQTYTLQLTKTLVDFGRNDAKYAGAAEQTRAKEAALEEAKEALAFRVARAYQIVVAAERAQTLTEEQGRLAQSRLATQRQSFKQGLRPESDVVVAEVEVGKSRLAGERAAQDARLARQALGNLTGDAASGEIPPAALKIRSPKEWDALLARLENKGENTAEKTGETAADRRRAHERAALIAEEHGINAATRPTLAGSIGAQEIATKDTDLKGNVFAQLAFNWDIPWSGQSREERQRVILKREALALEEAQDAKGKTDRIAVARLAITTAAKQWSMLGDQLQLLERQRLLVIRRYEAGKASALEVTASENDLVNARFDQAKLANAMAAAALDGAEAQGIIALEPLFE